MIIIAHRVNTVEGLKNVPAEFGVEIDVRHNNRSNGLYLNHDIGTGDDLEEYLKDFYHRFIIFNIKEAGVERQCINLAAKYNIPKANYFLLDVEFPYLYQATRKNGVREIAVRFSEAEPVEFALAQKSFCNWVWIDTNTKLPLDSSVIQNLNGFNTCLVSPDRWGRPEDIGKYRQQIKALNFEPDAVMVGLEHADLWQ